MENLNRLEILDTIFGTALRRRVVRVSYSIVSFFRYFFTKHIDTHQMAIKL